MEEQERHKVAREWQAECKLLRSLLLRGRPFDEAAEIVVKLTDWETARYRTISLHYRAHQKYVAPSGNDVPWQWRQGLSVDDRQRALTLHRELFEHETAAAGDGKFRCPCAGCEERRAELDELENLAIKQANKNTRRSRARRRREGGGSIYK